jgi:amino acid adenylation domain-containing protein/non-ribosomal peptide synthase protein (TIGR01720 family)
LWVLHRRDPGSVSYNNTFRFDLAGPLDRDALERAVALLVQRHEPLRSVFPLGPDGVPVQGVLVDPDFHLRSVEAGGASEEERLAHTAVLARAELAAAFDLTTEPPFRARLVRISGQHHALLLSIHHIAVDAWSVGGAGRGRRGAGVLLRELVEAYDAFATGRPPRLDDLVVAYGDYACWQRDVAASDVCARELSWWREHLAEPARAGSLTADRNPGTNRRAAGTVRLALRPELVVELRRTAQRHGVTPFAPTLAGFAAALERATGIENGVVGTTMAGRERPELECLVGNFVNIAALRVDVVGRPTYAELVRRAGQTLQGAWAHRLVPFEQVVSDLAPGRGGRPLFTTMVEQQRELQDEPVTVAGLEIAMRAEDPIEVDAALDAVLYTGAHPEVVAHFDASSYDAATIERFVERFAVELELLVADDGQRPRDHAVLTPSERHELSRWSEGPRPAEPRGLHDLVEDQAARTPDAIAVTTSGGGDEVTYRGLVVWAANVAAELSDLGVRREDRVGVVAERSAGTVAALLGVLRAGAAAVMLDPSDPAARRASIARDAAIVATVGGNDRGLGLPVVDPRAVTRDGPLPPRVVVDPRHIAYIVYTSGTTGVPRGVAVAHASASQFALAACDQFELRTDDRVMQFSSLAFDTAIEEVFPALAAGARVVLRPPGPPETPSAFAERCRRDGVTVLDLPTAYFHTIVRDRAISDTVRLLVIGGEQVAAAAMTAFASGGDRPCVLNTYGPTETTVAVTAADLTGYRGDVVPVGRPLPGVQLAVLDAMLRPVPIGAPGELCISGTPLARGYVGDAARTAERFVPNPFGANGGRLYRTGDRARWRSDGLLELLGRLDTQVKVRGFRLELGEVEAALLEHPAVSSAAVVARTVNDAVRLTAYVCVVGDRPDVAELRHHVDARVPSYAVPATVVFVDSLPLNARGKVDRAALEERSTNLVSDGEAVGAATRDPSGDVEAILADQIFRDVLGVDRVGVDDNFFELGGDSIQAIEVASRASDMGIAVTPAELFEHQTPAALARAIGAGVRAQPPQGPVVGRAGALPMQRWLLEQDLPFVDQWNLLAALAVRPRLAVPIIEDAFAALVAHHDALRLRVTPVRGELEHDVPGRAPSVSIHRVSDASSTPLAPIAAALQQHLSVRHGPLAAIAVVDDGREQVVLLAVHHLASDAVSMRILVGDLNRACAQLESGTEVSLPLKTTSFSEWSGRLARLAASGPDAIDGDHWVDPTRAAAAPLPVDYPESIGANVEGSVEVVDVSVDRDTTAMILDRIAGPGTARVDDVILAALASALARWSANPVQLVELTGHGREPVFADVDLTRTVGWLATLHPVLIDTGSDVRSALDAVVAHGRAVAHHGLGYGLARYLARDAATISALEALPEPEVNLDYLGRMAHHGEGRITALDTDLGFDRDPRNPRRHLLEVRAAIVDDELRLSIRHSREVHRRDTIERLCRDVVDGLNSLTAAAEPVVRERDAFGWSADELSVFGAAAERVVESGSAIDDVYPLTPVQQGLLFHTLLEGGGIYVVQTEWRSPRPVDPAAFEETWRVLQERHAVLRTSFVWEGTPEPVQVVHRSAPVDMTWLDWRDVAPPLVEERWRSLLDDDRAAGFDLRRAPLLRFIAVQLPDDSWRVVWTYHHLIVDGWSVAILLDECDTLLRSRGHPDAGTLEPAPPFRDYLAWCRGLDRSGDEAYWRAVMDHYRGSPRLQIDTGHTAGEWGEEAIEIGPGVTSALAEFAQRFRVTPALVVRAAWAVWLADQAGTDDVVFGTTFSGRPTSMPAMARVVGPFINSLPVRVRVPNGPVRSWIGDLGRQHADLLRREHTPLIEIKGWSAVAGDAPLFEWHTVFENYPGSASAGTRHADQFADLRFHVTAHYPLTLRAVPGPAMTLMLLHDVGRFPRDAVQRALLQLAGLLEQMAADPDVTTDALRARLGAIAVQARAEQRARLRSLTAHGVHGLQEEWAATRRVAPTDAGPHRDDT